MNITYNTIRNNVRMLMLGVALVATLSLVGCPSNTAQYGNLEGKVSIGPLCPVERVPPDPACQPTAATYAAWPIEVYSNTGAVVSELKPVPPDGAYSLALLPGDYKVDLKNHVGLGNSGLPAEIKVAGNQATTLDIVIDTGMR